MTQILSSWNMLEPQRKIVAVLALVATLVAFIGIARLASTPSMALLYSGLDSATSSEILTSLEQKSIAFEIRGDAIYVDSGARDRTRLSLAGEGLPSNGPAGYELLDSLSGFGTTSQMFDAAYWRAKEGELARTILASAQISMARVHLANPVQQPFSRGADATASVTVTAKGGALGVAQAEAIRYLVAAAVSGLSPAQVTVIDSNYGVVLQPGETSALATKSGDLDARAQELRANVERLLGARVGQGNVIVEVMVEARTESETITERTLDPEGSVAISSDSETQSSNSSGGAGGAVTVASNLPDTEGSGGADSSTNSQSRERINYDISETVRERIRPAGEIARLSVAVLVNGTSTQAANGTIDYTPRSDEELAAFLSLVQSTVGFNAERGDVVTIETMEFPQPSALGTTATAGLFSNFILNIPALLQMAVLAIVTLGLGLFVVKPILTSSNVPIARLTGNTLQSIESDPSVIDAASTNVSPPTAIVEAPKDPIEILRETIAQRSEESGHLLRNWIETDALNNTKQVS